ncbi:MAG: hypothetical protein KDA20_07820 [Phycisphaerales bacterium]|nr:hypothetical protein [Phycisphaerales bacterium]
MIGTALVIPLVLSACHMPENPSFPLTIKGAREDLRAMAKAPKALERPVVVLAGFFDPGFASGKAAEMLRDATGDGEHVVSVSFLTTSTFDQCRARVIEAVEKKFPSDDPSCSVEVDVVGISMGGLVGRYCAAPAMSADDGKRLVVRRLFTIGSPHRGADMAKLPTLDKRQLKMRAGSDFLAHLDDAHIGYEIVPYVRLGDTIVGERNAAPVGVTPWWVTNEPLELAHMQAFDDPRIICDIARRLRGDEPWTSAPAEPLPNK